MESPRDAVWIGHRRTGGRYCLRSDELHPGVNVLGKGAEALAGVLAASFAEAGLRTLVLDMTGRLSERAGGRIESKGLGHFLYDSMRLEECASLHAELAASAYTMALNLSFEQEGFLNSAIQGIALEEGVATPASLSDRLSVAGEFRGHTADELKGKLGAVRLLNVTGETGAVKAMVERGAVASFAGAESHQAAEVAVLLFLAKVLALGAAGVGLPDVLVVDGANRIFPNLPLTRHGNRILMALLSSEMARVFASETTYGLDHHFIETAHIRILSSALWNDVAVRVRPVAKLSSRAGVEAAGQVPSSVILTPNLFLLQDSARGCEEAFVPRILPAASTAAASGAGGPALPPSKDDTKLVRQILEIASTYETATRGSIVSYLSFDTPREEVEKAIDRLQNEGHLTVVSKDAKRDDPLQSVKPTRSGYDLLRSLS